MQENKIEQPQDPKWEHRLIDGADVDKQAEQVLQIAKGRFRKLIKEGLQKPHLFKKERKKKKPRPDTFLALADVAGLSMEEQVMMQIACLTQGVVDCTTRASSAPQVEEEDDVDGRYPRVPTAPVDARRSFRAAELHNQTHLAHATAQLVDTMSRIQGKAHVRHEFTYEHLHRPKPAAEPEQEPEPEETVDERADNMTEIMFRDIKLTPVVADPPPPPTSE